MGSVYFKLNYATSALVSNAQYGLALSGSLNNTAAWVEVAASPPIATGVWVIGWYAPSNFRQNHRIGIGASGSEVAQTGFVAQSSGPFVAIVPVWWAPSTRLAIQSSAAAFGAGTAGLYWRESLT